MENFESLALNRQLLNAIAEAGYTTPTPIQAAAIPLALAGHDVLGIAQTGTGKTAAYALPILMKTKFAQGTRPRALVLAPTRELALQIAQVFEQLSKYTDLRSAALIGGVGMKAQIERCEQGLDIVIATPGRLMDLYLAGHLYLRDIRVMVLDEADRMMDMGFMPQIRRILEVVPTKRQNLLFSATMPDKVLTLSEEFLEFPTRVEIARQATPADTIAQYLYKIPNLRTKINLVEHLLADEARFQRVIIFTRTKDIANNLYKYLLRKHPESAVKVIHANKGQNTRINAMDAFREGNVRVLVATDVVARGIDISEVSQVINFDVPIVYEDYVHRIGRTGRAGELGEAFSLVNPADEYHLKKIEQLIQQKINVLDIPAEVEITFTPHEEKQEQLREIDSQRKKEDPTFQGAFHEKKRKPKAAPKGKTPSKSSAKSSAKTPKAKLGYKGRKK